MKKTMTTISFCALSILLGGLFAAGQASRPASPQKKTPAGAKPAAPASKPVPVAPAPAQPSLATAPVPDPSPSLPAEPVEAVLQTSQGEIIIRFFPEAAPRHVAYFLKLAQAGYYDGTTFFRIIPLGIIQCGDPLTKDPAKRALYGSGGLNRLQAEFNSRPCDRGAVAAVLIPGQPNSAGSQFFICVTPQHQLNGKYTVFGQVVRGMEVVEAISQLPADDRQLARDRVVTGKVLIRPVPRPAFAATPAEELGLYHAWIVTAAGEIELSFFPAEAPAHVRQFLSFAAAGLYSGTDFHRVVPGFVIQGGAMSSRQPVLDLDFQDWLKPLKAEFNEHLHERGALSMARTSDPDSGMDSFFLCLRPQPSLDHKYTVFGRVEKGLEVMDAIAAAEVEGETPKQRIPILEIRVAKVR